MTIMGAQDIDEAVAVTAAALRGVADRDWSGPAAGLDWSCYDTAVHIAGDFTGYATQLTGRSTDSYVPFEIGADPGTPPAGLVRVIEATGGLLSAAVRTTPQDVTAWHPYGMAGADGFAAMGVVEALLHTYDILGALGEPGWRAPGHLAARVLDRLFPHAPRDLDATETATATDPWRTLLWATGRAGLGDLPRPAVWRWYAAPVRSERLLLCEVSPLVGADLRDGGSGGFAWAAGGPPEGTRIAGGLVADAREAGTYRPGWGTYVVVRAADRRAVGAIGFHAAPDADGRAEVGYDLVEGARGHGYMTEALRALTGWAFARPEAAVLRAVVDSSNTPSHGVVSRAGFTRAAEAEGRVVYELRRT
ncbi:GNAT family N-acetyltransferase [Streptomyces ficellus]|uniref:GNAT family N-acetyltransferase n=1 Tax=Streptomyces ficellus TaxID=1977088 RepID=A0A6I6FIN4_9ACTN|nr:GNAT family N-acetyltransferase [Streptomyces ficellus]QGV78955.1 GNAT family N-acetyltransferase [Streptomyces ficellus]